MNRQEYLSELSHIVVRNNWDLSSPGGTFDFNTKYHGPDEPICEEMKAYGRKLTASSSLEDKLIGYGLEAYGHYYRSLESATVQERKHPEHFSEYLPHWLHSDPEYITTDAFRALSGLFSKPNSIKIKKGKSYWR